MELSEFVSETLKGIIKGIKDAQDYSIENGARVNPIVGKWDANSTKTVYYGNEDGARLVSEIKFDIAVTASNKTEGDLNGGIKVLSLSFGGKSSTSNDNIVVSRISFEVPIVLPNVIP